MATGRAAKKSEAPTRAELKKRAGGRVAGMHRMPDGTMMKNSDMVNVRGRAVAKRKAANVNGRTKTKGV